MKILNGLTFVSAFLSCSLSFATTCTYTLDANSVQIDWTAFKTTQKVAVKGSFTELTLEGNTSWVGSLSDLLTQLSAEVPLKDQTSISTGNPARDQTLFQHFFKLFSKTPVITGSMHNFTGNDNEGDFYLHLKMNEKELAVPMSYTRDKNGHFLGKGGIDVLDFGLGGPLADLHKTCEALHQGPDGESKTWPIVEIRLSANITQKCFK